MQAIIGLKGAVTGYQLSNPHVKKALNMYLQDRQICLVYWLNKLCVEKALNMNSQCRQVSLGQRHQWWAFRSRDHTSVAHGGLDPQVLTCSNNFIQINSLTQISNLNTVTPSFVPTEKKANTTIKLITSKVLCHRKVTFEFVPEYQPSLIMMA